MNRSFFNFWCTRPIRYEISWGALNKTNRSCSESSGSGNGLTLISHVADNGELLITAFIRPPMSHPALNANGKWVLVGRKAHGARTLRRWAILLGKLMNIKKIIPYQCKQRLLINCRLDIMHTQYSTSSMSNCASPASVGCVKQTSYSIAGQFCRLLGLVDLTDGYPYPTHP